MGSLMFSEVNHFFGTWLKTHKLSNYELVITGRDIVSEINVREGSVNSYMSRYKNVDFSPRLAPSPFVEEQFWGGSRTKFVEAYREQLGTKEVMSELCAIIDLVVNKDLNVVLLTSKREWASEYFEYMREFIDENFKLYMVSSQEAMLDPGLLTSYGNDDEIRTMLAFQLKAYDLMNDDMNEFINRFTDDAQEKFEEFLRSRSIDQLCTIGAKYSVHVNKYKPKDEIVERILKKVLTK